MRLFLSLIVLAATSSAIAAGPLTVTSSRISESSGSTLMLENGNEVVGELLCERGDYKPNPSLEGKSNYLIHIDGDTNPEFNLNNAQECLVLFERLRASTKAKPVVLNLETKSGPGGQMSRTIGRVQ
jgi:hypothetical protein